VKVTQKVETFDDDCRTCVTILTDTGFRVSFSDGEPEDNTISRNFSDVHSILTLMKIAHEAGLRGETLEVEIVNEST